MVQREESTVSISIAFTFAPMVWYSWHQTPLSVKIKIATSDALAALHA